MVSDALHLNTRATDGVEDSSRGEPIDPTRHRLRLPAPPPQFPLVWEPGDEVELRPTGEIEARAAVLHLVLARCFGMPAQAAMSWLLFIAIAIFSLIQFRLMREKQ